MHKLIIFFVGAIIGWAIMTQVPGVPAEVVYGVTALFGIIPASVV